MVQPSARQLLEVVRFRPMIDTHAPARILAIEPDPGIGAVLHRILDKRVRGVLEVAPTIDAALASVARHVPDVILTSTFLPPADLARLIGELRRRDDAMHTQIISTPHALEAPDGPFYDDSGRILRFPRQRSHRGAFHCDPLILRNQVEQYLDHAHALRLAPNRQQHGLIPIAGPGLDGWLRSGHRTGAQHHVVERRIWPVSGASSSTPTAAPASWTSRAPVCGSRPLPISIRAA
jgi:CheY-like chemotaxis protein